MENKALREWNKGHCPEIYGVCRICRTPVNKKFALFIAIRIGHSVGCLYFCDERCYDTFVKEKKNE